MMKYMVNSNYLNVEAAAAILAALNCHYGEDCTGRVVETANEILGGRVTNIEIKHQDNDYLCKCVESY